RSQVRHDAVLPAERVLVALRGEACAHDHARIVDAAGRADARPEVSQFGDLALRPQKRPREAGRVEAVPGHLTGVVDVHRQAPGPSGRGPEIRHRAVLPEEWAVYATGSIVAPAHDLPRVVDSARIHALASEVPEVRDRPVVPEKSLAPSIHRPDDLALVVDRAGGRPRRHADIRHDAILPQEGSLVARRVQAGPDDLAGLVHIVREGLPPAEVPQVRHRPVLPEGRTGVPEVVVRALPHDLA